MDAPSQIVELVNRFREQYESYRLPSYNETQLRREFVDPFFKALGWDVDNEQGYAEAYKDVIHEDSIKIGGSTKAPDYAFRIGGVRKFFVETKKPSVNIRDDVSPAYQLRRYAWSAKLPLSILTDFEELAVYDCRVRPERSDKASTARTQYWKYDQYTEHWDEIASVFSRDAILKGSFDRYVESAKKKRGTAEVDDAFLKDIEQWRADLARNLALRNAELSHRDINFAVQKTIDRIIFLRICEDRGIEIYGQLQSLLNGERVYGRLCELFRLADDRYNSGLFHFAREKNRSEAPDEWTLSLTIDDRVLKDIVRRLYYPESPYEFSVLAADILGHVYEQFLGKVIRLTKGHQAKVEDKPEVKKAGGVYYTPTYIVDYIVQQTVGKLLEGKEPHEVAGRTRTTWKPSKHGRPLAVLDPACGSGSFLIGAYQYLLDWYRDWYVEHDTAQHKDRVYQTRHNQWRLTTAERKRILLDHIYGVDIDPQAVEVTKLSLLLKVLEGESQESLERQMRFLHERALPDLADNIKCGNSLIGPDFYRDKQGELFDDDERLRVNVFDWQAEFSAIMGSGGFDAVIGNPPYVRQESIKELKSYFRHHFRSFDSAADLYVYFIEQAVRLLKTGGLFSFVVSSSFLRTGFGRTLRAFLAESSAILELIDFGGLPVFQAAKDTYVCIPLIGRQSQPAVVSVCKVYSLDQPNLRELSRTTQYMVPAARFSVRSWRTDCEQVSAVFDRINEMSIPLGKFVDGRIFRGVITGLNQAFEVDSETRSRLVEQCPTCAPLLRQFLGGQDIRRYCIRETERYLIAIPSGWTRRMIMSDAGIARDLSELDAWKWFAEEFATIASHLLAFREAAKKRQDQGEFWWELRACDYYDVLDSAKIMYPDIAKEPRFFLDTTGMYIRNTAYCLGVSDPYLLGVLNSRLAWFAIGRISIPFGTRAGEYRYRMFTQYVEQIPIKPVMGREQKGDSLHGRMVSLVVHMLKLSGQFAAAKTTHEQTALARRIEATDREIDRLVYELYELTDDEIRIVEEATGR